jgi:hypothetical protein
MANCGWLWNDGTFIGRNDGGAWLMNDSSCAFEPGEGGGKSGIASRYNRYWAQRQSVWHTRKVLIEDLNLAKDLREAEKKLEGVEDKIRATAKAYAELEAEAEKQAKTQAQLRALEAKEHELIERLEALETQERELIARYEVERVEYERKLVEREEEIFLLLM